MVWNYLNDDGMNKLGLRNIRNTPRHSYNCAGYALGLFSWYTPFNSARYYALETRRQYHKLERETVNQMLQDMPNLRLISDDIVREKAFDINKYTVIAFRLSRDDYHYYRLGRNWQWYDKRGATPKIYSHSYNKVWENWGRFGQYDGKIYFFLKAR
jgi:hypothetical protein